MWRTSPLPRPARRSARTVGTLLARARLTGSARSHGSWPNQPRRCPPRQAGISGQHAGVAAPSPCLTPHAPSPAGEQPRERAAPRVRNVMCEQQRIRAAVCACSSVCKQQRARSTSVNEQPRMCAAARASRSACEHGPAFGVARGSREKARLLMAYAQRQECWRTVMSLLIRTIMTVLFSVPAVVLVVIIIGPHRVRAALATLRRRLLGR